MSFLNVASPDAGGEAVGSVIGLSDKFVGVAEGDGGDDGTEDFFLHDLHLRVGVDQHRRLDEVALVAMAVAADYGPRAFTETGFEIRADAVELFFGDQRSHIVS